MANKSITTNTILQHKYEQNVYKYGKKQNFPLKRREKEPYKTEKNNDCAICTKIRLKFH